MGDQPYREAERLRAISVRAFRAAFDEATPRQLEEVLGTDTERASETGNDWGFAVGYDAGAALVFWSAVTWKFDRQIADAVTSLLANAPDPACVPDVMAAAVRVDKPYDLRDAALARLGRAMAGSREVPEPVVRLQSAFQAAQRAADVKGRAAGRRAVPVDDSPPGPYREALRGWIRGVLEGHQEGTHDTLRRIIHERFGDWMTMAASLMLDERIDGPRAGVLATVLLDINQPLGVLYWTEEIASMKPEELRQVTSQRPPSRDDPVPWPWPPRRPPAADD